MEESTAESTAENADTLRMELKKTMTEILGDGGVSEDRGQADGSSRVLKAIDEAVRILNRLREVESKMAESADTSSSSPAASVLQVPKEFKCMLSRAIMSEPVVIASGQVWFYLRSFLDSLRFLLDFANNKQSYASHCQET